MTTFLRFKSYYPLMDSYHYKERRHELEFYKLFISFYLLSCICFFVLHCLCDWIFESYNFEYWFWIFLSFKKIWIKISLLSSLYSCSRMRVLLIQILIIVFYTIEYINTNTLLIKQLTKHNTNTLLINQLTKHVNIC